MEAARTWVRESFPCRWSLASGTRGAAARALKGGDGMPELAGRHDGCGRCSVCVAGHRPHGYAGSGCSGADQQYATDDRCFSAETCGRLWICLGMRTPRIFSYLHEKKKLESYCMTTVRAGKCPPRQGNQASTRPQPEAGHS